MSSVPVYIRSDNKIVRGCFKGCFNMKEPNLHPCESCGAKKKPTGRSIGLVNIASDDFKSYRRRGQWEMRGPGYQPNRIRDKDE